MDLTEFPYKNYTEEPSFVPFQIVLIMTLSIGTIIMWIMSYQIFQKRHGLNEDKLCSGESILTLLFTLAAVIFVFYFCYNLMEPYKQLYYWLNTSITVDNKALIQYNCSTQLDYTVIDHPCYISTISVSYQIYNTSVLHPNVVYYANKTDEYNYALAYQFLDRYPSEGSIDNGFYNPFEPERFSYFIGYRSYEIIGLILFTLSFVGLFLSQMINCIGAIKSNETKVMFTTSRKKLLNSIDYNDI